MKEFLSNSGVAYVERNVEADPSAIEDLKQLTGKLAVPVTVIGEQTVVGFDSERLKALLQT